MSSSEKVLEARFLGEPEFPAWRDFVDTSPAGSIYSYPEYLDVLCRVSGGSFRVLAVFKGGEIHGGIALYERGSIAGTILSGRLLLYYNGIVLREFRGKHPSENSSRELAILSALEGALSRMGLAHVEIRNRHPISDIRVFLARGWMAHPSYSLLMQFDNLDDAFGRVEQNQRRLVRRCQEAGAVLSFDDDFDAFYRMHLGTHLRKAAPVYLPEASFRRYFRDLASQSLCRLFHVRMGGGRPAASQLVLLGGHPVTHTVTAAADPEFLRLGTTPFLRWKVCEALAAEGYRGNDLTDASLNEVTRFKAQMGGELVTNLVLSRPDALSYRIHRSLGRGSRLVRGLLGRMLRTARPSARQAARSRR
jgi:hypothetical protein